MALFYFWVKNSDNFTSLEHQSGTKPQEKSPERPPQCPYGQQGQHSVTSVVTSATVGTPPWHCCKHHKSLSAKRGQKGRIIPADTDTAVPKLKYKAPAGWGNVLISLGELLCITDTPEYISFFCLFQPSRGTHWRCAILSFAANINTGPNFLPGKIILIFSKTNVWKGEE